MSKLSLGVEKAASLPSIPDTSASVAVLSNACRSIYAQRDDLIGALPLATADEMRRRSAAIEEYLRGTEAFPDAQRAARVLEMAVGAALGPASRNGKGGRGLPASNPIEPTLRHEFRALHTGRDKIEPFLENGGLSREAALRIARMADLGKGVMTSDEVDWHTPLDIIERVITTLGSIDLDPCSNDGTPRIPAARHFTVRDDGLAQEWTGRVYMNPPYGTAIGAWVEKLSMSFEDRTVTEAIALVPARVDTAWWFRIPAECVCFVRGRLTFSDVGSPAPFPSAVVYLGSRPERFARSFSDVGGVYRAWEPLA